MFHFPKLLFTAAGLCLTIPLNAESVTVTGPSAPTARVSLAGLDLDSLAGQSQAENRIRAAANGLCSSSAVEPVNIRMARKACHSSALASGRNDCSASSRARPWARARWPQRSPLAPVEPESGGGFSESSPALMKLNDG